MEGNKTRVTATKARRTGKDRRRTIKYAHYCLHRRATGRADLAYRQGRLVPRGLAI